VTIKDKAKIASRGGVHDKKVKNWKQSSREQCKKPKRWIQGR